jgi:hypothetical protein
MARDRPAVNLHVIRSATKFCSQPVMGQIRSSGMEVTLNTRSSLTYRCGGLDSDTLVSVLDAHVVNVAVNMKLENIC